MPVWSSCAKRPVSGLFGRAYSLLRSSIRAIQIGPKMIKKNLGLRRHTRLTWAFGARREGLEPPTASSVARR
jgi:hypothetical protein